MTPDNRFEVLNSLESAAESFDVDAIPMNTPSKKPTGKESRLPPKAKFNFDRRSQSAVFDDNSILKNLIAFGFTLLKRRSIYQVAATTGSGWSLHSLYNV